MSKMIKKHVSQLTLTVFSFCFAMSVYAEMPIWPPQEAFSANGHWKSNMTKTDDPTRWQVNVYAADKQYKMSDTTWSRVIDFDDKGGNRFYKTFVAPNGQSVVYTAGYSPNGILAAIVQPNCTKHITAKDVTIKPQAILTSPPQWLKQPKSAEHQAVVFDEKQEVVYFETLSGRYAAPIDCK